MISRKIKYDLKSRYGYDVVFTRMLSGSSVDGERGTNKIGNVNVWFFSASSSIRNYEIDAFDRLHIVEDLSSINFKRVYIRLAHV